MKSRMKTAACITRNTLDPFVFLARLVTSIEKKYNVNNILYNENINRPPPKKKNKTLKK